MEINYFGWPDQCSERIGSNELQPSAPEIRTSQSRPERARQWIFTGQAGTLTWLALYIAVTGIALPVMRS
jgi:hypothetical protein